jgi:hypothetical protein
MRGSVCVYDRAMPSRTIVLLLASVLALGCSDKAKLKQAELEQDRKRISLDSTHDASAAVVDEGYRFRLDNPGPGWKTLGEADARKINPDALAMATNNGNFIAVFVEHIPGADLDGFVDLLLSSYYVTAKAELREPTRFADSPGIRLKYSEAGDGIAHEARVVIRGDYVYRVEAWRTAASKGPTNFDPAFAAFSLLDGDVVPRESAVTQVLDAHGTGWLLNRGTFRSNISGLEIAGDDSLRMLVGGELHEYAPAAEVGFTGARSSFFAVIEPQPWDVRSLAESRRGRSEDLAERYADSLEVGALELIVLGQPVPLDARTQGPLRYYSGAFDLGGMRMQVDAWWPQGLDQGNRPRLLELAARIQQMDEGMRAATAAALAELPIAEQSVGPGWAIRNGSYRDFERGIVWTAPRSTDAAWVFLTGADAATWDPDATVTLLDRRSGRIVVLVHVPNAGSASEAAWREQIAELWPGVSVARREPFALAGHAGEFVYGEVSYDDGPGPVYLVSLQVGDHGLALLQEAPTEATARVLREELLAGFVIHDRLPELEQRGLRWYDHRMGISLEVPSSWTATDRTPEPIAPYSRVTTWTEAGREKLVLLEIHAQQIGQDLDWAEGFVEQLARDTVGIHTKDVAKRRAITIAGIPGRELSWSEPPMSVHMVRNGGTFCMLIASGTKSAEITAISNSLEFLE